MSVAAGAVAALGVAITVGMPSGAFATSRELSASAGSPGSPGSAGTAQSAAALGTPSAVTPAKDVARIVLDTMSPTVVKAGTDLTITGTVTAPLTGPLSGPQLRVIRGDVTVNQKDALDAWASGRTPTSGHTVATQTLTTVPAGQSTPFTVTIPWRDLYTDLPFAALPIAVEVVQEGATQPVGMTRTFVAWNNRKEYIPLQIATVLPLTLDPATDLFSSSDTTRVQAWNRAIGPDSRVQRIVTGTDGSPVTLAVDPSVFGPVATPTDSSGSTGSTPGATPGSTGTPAPGSTSPDNPGSTSTSPATPTTTPPATPPATPSTGETTPPSAAAVEIQRLGDGLAAQLHGRSIWALPYADADIAATVPADPANTLVRDLVSRSSAVGQRIGQKARGDIVWPVDGLMPDRREQGVKRLLAGTTVKKPAGIIVSQPAVSKASPYTPTARRVTASGTRLLAYDPRLSSLLPKRSDPTPVLPIQRYLAETLVLLGERAGTARSVLVTAPRTYDPDADALATFLAATTDVPWLDVVDPASLLTDDGNDKALEQQKPAAPVPSAAPPPVLNAQRLDRMATQRDTLLSVADVLENGAEFERTYREVLDELASVRWRYEPESWAKLAASVDAEIKAATSAIRVVPRRVNFLAESGTFPITVANGLDYAVDDIRLRLVSTDPRIQIVEQPGPISIGPSSRTNVPVEVAAVAAGKAVIKAYLTTADGTPIGSPADIAVSANPIDGAIYWIGGALVVLVLVFGIARTVLKGTSRIDEIGDIEAVTAAHEAAENRDDD
ncbi:DUF6049 family protein [Intrasporangium mesophilum]